MSCSLPERSLFSVQHFAGKTVVAGAAKKKKKKKKGNCPALSGSALISLPACAGATVFSCSWLRHHCHFYSPFPFAARALHVESALC